jgi:hypothetical protein
MTVIAWDGRMVAADSMLEAGGYVYPRGTKKLILFDGNIYATSGAAGLVKPCMDWVLRNDEPENMPKVTDPQGYNFMVFMPDGVAHARSNANPYPYEPGAPDAWGSGCDFAIGAMLHGADAWDAALVACRANPHCSPPIQAYVINKGVWVEYERN